MMTLLFSLSAITVIAMIILGIFKSSLYGRLSTRIAVLIVGLAPIALITFIESRDFAREVHTPWLGLLEIILIVLGGPVVFGLLAARYVQRPLRQFTRAVASLEENHHTTQLQPSGIHEFDEVFKKFNGLLLRLHREEKLRKDLISDTSHELHTPLTTIIGQLTAIQEGKYPMTKERVNILKEQAERLAELMQQLDAYTKARIPDPEKPENIAIKQFCQQLIGQFAVELQKKGITVSLDIADDLVVVANRSALQRIIANFVQNTLRYSEATRLTIVATSQQLTFSDNGKGVPAESLPYLFDRFYRVDKSRSRKTGGLGLGLAIVKELVEQQGWHMQAKDAQPGIVFVITWR